MSNLSSSKPTSTQDNDHQFQPNPHIPWTTSLVPTREQRDDEFDQDMVSLSTVYPA